MVGDPDAERKFNGGGMVLESPYSFLAIFFSL